MNIPSSVNSSDENATSALGVFACCHQSDLLKAHFDRPDLRLCMPCLSLIFIFEANGDVAHLAYAFWTNVIQGDAR